MSNNDDRYIFEPTAFDYVNPKAEVVIVGITPGNSQLDGSREGMSPREIKRKYAFAGKMRHAEKIAKSEKLTRMLEEGFVKNCSSYENPVL